MAEAAASTSPQFAITLDQINSVQEALDMAKGVVLTLTDVTDMEIRHISALYAAERLIVLAFDQISELLPASSARRAVA